MFKPFRLERFFAEHEFSSRYLLCTSDCESMPVADLLALEPGVQELLASTWLGYTESRGSPALRGEIAALYEDMNKDSIIVHAGAEEAILNLYLAIVRRGDTVIVNSPCYQSLREIPRALGARILPWKIRPDSDRWFLDPAELARLLEKSAGSTARRGRPALVVMNMPHNPTGALMRKNEYDEVVRLCRKHGAILVVDEVYRLLERNPSERLPAACDAYEDGVSLSVLSKAWGLAGLRIGWLASKRRDILDEVAVVKDYNSICVSAPSETLAGIAVRHTEEITARSRALCAANLALFESFFDARSDIFEWIPPRAGSVAFPRLRPNKRTAQWRTLGAAPSQSSQSGAASPRSGADAELLALELLNDTGVLLLPGTHYAYDPSYFRIGLGRISTGEALRHFDEWLKGKGL